MRGACLAQLCTWKLVVDPHALPRVETEMLLADGPTRRETNGIGQTDGPSVFVCVSLSLCVCHTHTTHCRLLLSCLSVCLSVGRPRRVLQVAPACQAGGWAGERAVRRS